MGTRKLQGPLGGEYLTDGSGNAILMADSPITDDNRLGARLTTAEGRQPEAWSDFRSAPDGAPTALDSGQSWRLITNTTPDRSLTVISGALTNAVTSGNNAGYAEVHLADTVTRIGAKVTFGSYSAETGGVCLAILAAPFNNSSIPNMSCHFVLLPTRYTFSVWENPGSKVDLQVRVFPTPLAADETTEHTVEIQIIGSTAYFMVGGTILGQVTDARIAALGGPYAFWEIYATNAATGSKGRFREVWADSRVESFRATGASLATLAQVACGRAEVTVRQFDTGSSPTTLVLSTSYQEIHSDLRCPVLFGPSGKLLVEFTGYANIGTSAPTMIAFFYDASLSTSAASPIWIHQGSGATNDLFHVRRVITKPENVSGTLYVAARNTAGTGTLYMGENYPNLLKVTSL